MAPVTCTDINIGNLRKRLDACHALLKPYTWLIDSFVLDFFTEHHYEKLPRSWACAMDRLSPEELGQWIVSPAGQCTYEHDVLPLSLLAFKQALQSAALDRRALSTSSSINQYLKRQNYDFCDKDIFWKSPNDEDGHSGEHKKLGHIFKKHVKPKKQHEIFRLSQTCGLISRATQCETVVDAGAGIGHLSRHLCYCQGLKVVCLESEEKFGLRADKLDAELGEARLKQGIAIQSKPEHVTVRLDPRGSNLAQVLTSTLPSYENITKLGLIGLHTCGDLGPILIRNFAHTSEIQFLALVGCCYMKMDLTGPPSVRGYPMSEYVQNLAPSLISYEALEVSCHAIENYCDRLTEAEVDKLKVHCYRATLETVLIQLDPQLKRAGLRGVKNAHLMSFQEYCRKALYKLDIHVDENHLKSEYIDSCLKQWKRVVAFYTLRLLLSTVMETAIQLDRLLYLKEQGFDSLLVPLFDCRLSPRNYTLISVKPKPSHSPKSS